MLSNYCQVVVLIIVIVLVIIIQLIIQIIFFEIQAVQNMIYRFDESCTYI